MRVNSTNAPIAVSGTTGGIQIDTVNGPVKVSGGGGTIEIRSLTGDVDYSGAGRRVDAETVSGAVRLDLTAADAHVRTVKGAVTVRGRILSELGIETTAGNVTVEAGDGGNWRIETFSGSVSLALPATTSARFHLKSAEGSITSNVGPKARREERFNPFRILEFRVGDASSDIEIETYSGAITLKVAGVSALTSTPDGNGVASSGRADATLIH